MSNEIITVRLRRDHAEFLEANLALMADRTRAAMADRYAAMAPGCQNLARVTMTREFAA